MEIKWKKREELIREPKTYSLPELFAMAALVSLLGFLTENTWMLIRSGFIDNRNMNLPFLLGYGLAVVGKVLRFLLLGLHESSDASDTLHELLYEPRFFYDHHAFHALLL